MDCVGVVSWLKCYCLQVIGCVGAGLWLGCYCLLIIGCVVCCVVIGILLLESFRLCRCNALTSVCYYYSSLTFEVEEVWCTDSTRTSGWVNVEYFLYMKKRRCQHRHLDCAHYRFSNSIIKILDSPLTFFKSSSKEASTSAAVVEYSIAPCL